MPGSRSNLYSSVKVLIQITREGRVPAVLSVLTVCTRRINPAQRPRPGHTHSVPEGVCSDRVLGGQRAAAKDDEDEDEVSEDVMVDQGVTAHTDPGGRQTHKDQVSSYLHTLFFKTFCCINVENVKVCKLKQQICWRLM